jgi:hypothetical protein
MTAAGFVSKLMVGLAEMLDTLSIGTWTASSVYDDDDAPIITLDRLPDSPDQVVCLSDYRVSANGRLTDSVIGVQVRTRAPVSTPSAARDLADAVLNVWHGAAHLTLGTSPNVVSVSQILFQSAAPLGPDQRGRQERSMNFYIYANVPSSTGNIE